VPTRAVRCTKAEPQPCAAAALPTVDSNHDQHNQTVPSYRLDEWALSDGACAARESNSVRRIKSPEHHRLCLRHLRAVPGN
jgi:hypothetical protein